MLILGRFWNFPRALTVLSDTGTYARLVQMLNGAKNGRRRGFTLTEVIVSALIFSIVAAGVVSATMMTGRLAYQNIYENTAYMVAQGYAEQIKSIQYARIRQALNDPVNHSIPTESLSLGSQESLGDLKQEDPLTFGVEQEKEVIVDIEKDASGTERNRIMRMWITPRGDDLAASGSCWDSIEITIDFEWEVFTGSGFTRESGDVRVVKTNVSEY